MKKYYYLVIIYVLSGVMFILSCSGKNDKGAYSSGTLEATEILVSSETAGQIILINVEEGDPVTAGQVIARIDSEKICLQKRQIVAGLEELALNLQNAERAIDLARDNMDNTQKKYDRVKALLADESTTQQNFDDVETALKSAITKYNNALTSLDALKAKQKQVEAQLALINRQLADTRILAPVSGTVVEKYMDQGELAGPGSPLFLIADLSKMWIKMYITEADFGRVKPGGAAWLETGLQPPQTFKGTITWISPKAEFTPKNVQTKEARADLVYAVKVVVDNPDGLLKIGMPADVYVE
ncbi:efflux RND transporter periplasmic adaptor subunit [candidate division KSB1 bacterium]|nr:efflux RND transporter periplasmic adaptor subunit [candidate division KSB1 bacterium]